MNVIASNITSSLGMTVAEHWLAVETGRRGIREYTDEAYSNASFFASKLESSQWQYIQTQTKSNTLLLPFEQLAVFSAREALGQCEPNIDLREAVLVLSTTKGNIEWLGQLPDERLWLHTSAHIISSEVGIRNKPVVISHACASGVIALIYGVRLLETRKYKHVVVTGCDRFSRFILKGFQSFQALADEPCKPFDLNRNGINLGEGAATIVLSSDERYESAAQLISGATSNDANHISGPSRTGNELAIAIDRAIKRAGITNKDIDMVGAHGTATIYNDEMEAKAFGLSGLSKTPLHSFKGYAGHTLGAAGILESTMIIEAMRQQCLIPSIGFTSAENAQELNITKAPITTDINYALKTASGFGGCNAVVVLKKT